MQTRVSTMLWKDVHASGNTHTCPPISVDPVKGSSSCTAHPVPAVLTLSVSFLSLAASCASWFLMAPSPVNALEKSCRAFIGYSSAALFSFL